jgi:hypothetical protein
MTEATKQQEDPQTSIQKLIAASGLKAVIDKLRGDLDKVGVDRKDLDASKADEDKDEEKEVTPEAVDVMRDAIMAAAPDLDEEVAADILQAIVDGLSEELPESDVEEEMALEEGEDKEDEKQEDDEDEDRKAFIKLAGQVTEMAKGYEENTTAIAELVGLVHKAIDVNVKQVKENDDLRAELNAIKKQLGQRPTRASRATETEVDEDSDLAKTAKANKYDDVPSIFSDMIPEG